MRLFRCRTCGGTWYGPNGRFHDDGVPYERHKSGCPDIAARYKNGRVPDVWEEDPYEFFGDSGTLEEEG